MAACAPRSLRYVCILAKAEEGGGRYGLGLRLLLESIFRVNFDTFFGGHRHAATGVGAFEEMLPRHLLHRLNISHYWWLTWTGC